MLNPILLLRGLGDFLEEYLVKVVKEIRK